MASAPQNSLPLFYNDLMPLNSRDHANWKAKETDALPWLATANAIPLTIDEFPLAQRYLPIVFSSGDNPIPLGLMGLNEGVNVYVDSDGRVTGPTYVPAYVRRYPFMLTKLTPDATDLSLCFDPTSGLIGEFEEGHALFDGDKPAEAVERTLNFCEQFDQAAQRTKEGDRLVGLHRRVEPSLFRQIAHGMRHRHRIVRTEQGARTFVGVDNPQQHADRGGLARTVGAEDAVDRAFGHGEIDARDREGPFEALEQPLGLDRQLVHHARPV